MIDVSQIKPKKPGDRITAEEYNAIINVAIAQKSLGEGIASSNLLMHAKDRDWALPNYEMKARYYDEISGYEPLTMWMWSPMSLYAARHPDEQDDTVLFYMNERMADLNNKLLWTVFFAFAHQSALNDGELTTPYDELPSYMMRLIGDWPIYVNISQYDYEQVVRPGFDLRPGVGVGTARTYFVKSDPDDLFTEQYRGYLNVPGIWPSKLPIYPDPDPREKEYSKMYGLCRAEGEDNYLFEVSEDPGIPGCWDEWPIVGVDDSWPFRFDDRGGRSKARYLVNGSTGETAFLQENVEDLEFETYHYTNRGLKLFDGVDRVVESGPYQGDWNEPPPAYDDYWYYFYNDYYYWYPYGYQLWRWNWGWYGVWGDLQLYDHTVSIREGSWFVGMTPGWGSYYESHNEGPVFPRARIAIKSWMVAAIHDPWWGNWPDPVELHVNEETGYFVFAATGAHGYGPEPAWIVRPITLAVRAFGPLIFDTDPPSQNPVP